MKFKQHIENKIEEYKTKMIDINTQYRKQEISTGEYINLDELYALRIKIYKEILEEYDELKK